MLQIWIPCNQNQNNQIVFLLVTIYWDHKISDCINDLSFSNKHVIIVHKKIVKKVYTKTNFDEIWYIIE